MTLSSREGLRSLAQQIPAFWPTTIGAALILFSNDARRIYTVSSLYASQSVVQGLNMYLGALVLLIVALVLFRKPGKSLTGWPWVPICAAVALSAMNGLMYLGEGLQGANLPLPVIAGLYTLSTLGMVVLVIGWMESMRGLRMRSWFFCLGCALILLGLMELADTCILAQASSVIITLAPLASAALLLRTQRLAAPEEAPAPREHRKTGKPLSFLVIALVLFFVTTTLLSNLAFTIERISVAAETPPAVMQALYAAGVLAAGGTLAIAAGRFWSRTIAPYFFLIVPGCYGISFMLLNAGNASVAYLALLPLGLMRRLALLLPLLYLNPQRERLSAAACLAGIAYLLGSVVGSAPLFRSAANPDSVLYDLTVAVGFTVLLALSIALVALRPASPEKAPSSRKDTVGSSPVQQFGNLKADAISAIAATYELTPRETEILVLLGDGWRSSSIAEKLTLSQTTVKNHMGRIYRKLDVHSQQEIMAMIEHEALSDTPNSIDS